LNLSDHLTKLKNTSDNYYDGHDLLRNDYQMIYKKVRKYRSIYEALESIIKINTSCIMFNHNKTNISEQLELTKILFQYLYKHNDDIHCYKYDGINEIIQNMRLNIRKDSNNYNNICRLNRIIKIGNALRVKESELYNKVNRQFKYILDINNDIHIQEHDTFREDFLKTNMNPNLNDHINILDTLDKNMYSFNFKFTKIVNDTYHECSNGETMLIVTLAEIFMNDKKILFIDEQFNELHYQAKKRLMDSVLRGLHKQVIMVTHNSEFIANSINENIIYFKYNIDNHQSTCKYIRDYELADKKMIYERPIILFSNRILLVEGYSDLRFMREFLKVINNNEYVVITTNGCGSGLFKILKRLRINYKCLYDIDVLSIGTNNTIDIVKCNVFSNKHCISWMKDEIERIFNKLVIMIPDDILLTQSKNKHTYEKHWLCDKINVSNNYYVVKLFFDVVEEQINDLNKKYREPCIERMNIKLSKKHTNEYNSYYMMSNIHWYVFYLI
jgi:hypothetical protein